MKIANSSNDFVKRKGIAHSQNTKRAAADICCCTFFLNDAPNDFGPVKIYAQNCLQAPAE